MLYFDVASIATPDIGKAHAAEIVTRIREVGVDKVLYGSDAATPTNMKPVDA